MLLVENISKTFSGVTALRDVSLELYPGQVNAIIGENGAGKSTLMKILSGVYTEYDGRVLLNNSHLRFKNTREAQEAGIAIIHQELNLVQDMSIAENIFLGRELTNRFGLLDRQRMNEKATELLSKVGLSIDPSTKVSSLKVGQQQLIEIAKALLLDASAIIMDEPTSAISEKEVNVLFGIIARLKSEGKIIVYISHKLDELSRIADRYIVLRDGTMITSGLMSETSADDLVQKMVGREIIRVNRAARTDSNRILSTPHFQLAAGEVLGIFGLMGAGRTELLETLFGLKGEFKVTVDSKEVIIKSPADAIKAGIALVPEDRKKDGLFLDLDVHTNMTITTLNDLVDRTGESELTEKYVRDLRIKSSSTKQLAGTLSGGNQQKIVLAKWLATNPKILMLDEPTRGIDINAKLEIYQLIRQLAEGGMGVILVSSELPEILAVSDRILVMAENKFTAELLTADATENAILKAAIPGN